MTRTRAVVLLFVVVIGAAAALVPAARDELSWWWAESHDHAVDFTTYLEVWPHGRHSAEARLKYDERRWVETQEAMIRQAYQEASRSSPEADVQYRREKHLRRDSFFWKAATSVNTVQSYQDYLQQFPDGRFAALAHARIDALSHGSQGVPPVSSPPAQ
ncbi:MAG TPA: hypothetical protein VMR33_07365 [Candidatus Baltobacteraceae bacterium]|jgi:hypothetical protein|nr:hypothetical protein [Candidatus Baltobacteraceae bacterium]